MSGLGVSDGFRANVSPQGTYGGGFNVAVRPAIFHDVLEKLAGDSRKVIGRPHNPSVEGFEDLLPKNLGSGFWYNSYRTIEQLAMAIALSPHPSLSEIIKNDTARDSAAVVGAFRTYQVLAGMKILDLGSGIMPGFAIASRSMGAEAYTADGVDLDDSFRSRLSGHVVIDLTNPEASAVLQEATGSDHDIVSENIMGNVRGAPRFEIPKKDVIMPLGQTLLRTGGHLHRASVDGFGSLLQKI